MRLKLQHLPEPVAARLRCFHLTRQLSRVARWGLGTLSLYGLLLLLAVQLDRFLFLDIPFRVGMWWAVHGLAGAVGLAGLLSLILRRHTSREVSYDFEASVQEQAHEHYVTLDHVLRNGGQEPSDTRQKLIAHLTHGTLQHAGQPLRLRPSRDHLLRVLGSMVLGLGVLMGCLLAIPDYRFGLMLQRFYCPESALPKPSFLQLVVSPAEPIVGKGEEVALQVAVKGRLPQVLDWLYRKAGHSSSRCVMSLGPERKDFRFDAGTLVELSRVQRDLFLYSKADMASNINFIVRCGDAQTEVKHVEVVAQPVVTEVVLEVTPPDYSGQVRQTVTNLAQPLQFLAGSKVVVKFKTDQAVPKREVRFEKVPRPQAHTWNEAERAGRFEFVLKKRVVFEIAVQNGSGFANRERVRGIINLREDLPPTVQLDDPPPDVEKVAGELITFRAGITDDLGIREVSLRYVVNPDPDEDVPMKELPIPIGTNGITSTNVVMDFDLERVGAAPGDLVVLQLRARDTAGNDGVSRETRIRVMPFTRDENERLRLRTLLFVQDVLALNVEAGLPAYSGGDSLAAPMSEKAESAVKAAARKAGIAYAEGSTWEPLFELLEREHHFTDRPRNKDDVRMLRAILWNIIGVSSAQGPVARGDARTGELRRLNVAIIPGLCRLRQAKNLTWRMFGMLGETDRIIADLKRDIDPQSPAARSLERRLQIYLAAIQDLGEELSLLNQGAKWVEPEVLRKQVGTMNTAAYSVKRGSAARRRAACRQVAEGLNTILSDLRPAYSRLLKDEMVSRSRLMAQYQECLVNTVRPAGDLTKEGYGAAAAWLAEEGRLMSGNPFSSLWSRCLYLALLDGMEALSLAPSQSAEAIRRKNAIALLAPVSGGDLIARDRRGMQRMAFEWENRGVLAESVSDLEKVLQLTISEMEESVANNESLGQAENRLARISGFTNGEQAVIASFDFRDAGEVSGGGDAAPTLIPGLIRENSLVPAPLASVRHLRERMVTDTAALDVILRARQTISDVSGKQVADMFGSEIRALQELAQVLELTILAGGPEQDSSRLEWLMTLVREQQHRFDVTTRSARRTLRRLGATRLDEAGMSVLVAELDKCPALRESLVKAVESWGVALEQGGGPDEAEKNKYPILRNYDRSRDIYKTLIQMQAPDAKPAELSRMMRARYPDLASGYLAEGLSFVEVATESARIAEAALRQSTPDMTQAVTRVKACRTALASLRQHVDRSGSGDVQVRVGRGVDEALRQIESMKVGDLNANAETVSRLVFMLGEVSRVLATISVDLKAAAQLVTQGFSLNGGPDGIWEPANRLAADRSQRRLSRQLELAVRFENRGILEGGTTEGAALLSSATAWGALVFAIDRSELNPSEGIRLGGSGGDEQANPLVKYLREEIQKARQMPALKHDAEYVRQYLDALYDYLRY